MFIYDGYHSFQGTNRESKAHTLVEKQIEQSEDTLSRADRIIRLFTFRDKVQIALNQRVSKEHWVKGDVIPEYTKNALIAIEDKRYYKHGAIDVLGIIRAFYTNTIAGETVEGGSTITQQVVKNSLLTSDKSLQRKIQEAYLSLKLENRYSKDDILETFKELKAYRKIVKGNLWKRPEYRIFIIFEFCVAFITGLFLGFAYLYFKNVYCFTKCYILSTFSRAFSFICTRK